MELVYLWVEDYKNIKNQGFNFSPKFHCEYNKNTNELMINENDDYIENFFGDNINVTAIVGKNGSGKSSILNYISLLTLNGVTTTNKYIIFFKNRKNDEFLIYSNIDDISKQYINLKPIYIKQEEYDNNYSHKLIKLINKFKLYAKNDTNLSFISFIYIPKMINIEFNLNLDDKLLEYLDKDYFSNVNEWGKINGVQEDEEKERLRKKIESLEDNIKIILFNTIDTTNKSKLQDLILDWDNKATPKQREESNILKSIRTNDFIEITEDFIKKIEKYTKYYTINFKDINGVVFDSLSSGEQQYSFVFLESYESIASNSSLSIIYAIDEAETFLHPDWQKRLVNDLIKVFKEDKSKNIHFILTSHSPFLLSDIPKQNIIFLDTDEKGNCKVVDGLKDKKQTFGANIHTLLSDSFFMEDGLMGEFAKGKINEITHFYKMVEKRKHLICLKNIYLTKQKKFWQIQKIIGEPFLQKIIKNKLEEIELILLGKNEAIDNEITRLQALKREF